MKQTCVCAGGRGGEGEGGKASLPLPDALLATEIDSNSKALIYVGEILRNTPHSN